MAQKNKWGGIKDNLFVSKDVLMTEKKILQISAAAVRQHVKQKPALWDAKYFSAQKRARYFWGNIPGLYSTPAVSVELRKPTSLSSMLSPLCNRKAKVETLRTVTTRSNSLMQGKDDIFPVTMDGKEDTVWVTELERVFGFPAHYTDVGDMNITKRRKVLGKAWSVPVIKHLLSPLRKYFLTTDK